MTSEDAQLLRRVLTAAIVDLRVIVEHADTLSELSSRQEYIARVEHTITLLEHAACILWGRL